MVGVSAARPTGRRTFPARATTRVPLRRKIGSAATHSGGERSVHEGRA